MFACHGTDKQAELIVSPFSLENEGWLHLLAARGMNKQEIDCQQLSRVHFINSVCVCVCVFIYFIPLPVFVVPFPF